MPTSTHTKKALKRAYDEAWRNEPCWEFRKRAGKAARKAVFDYILRNYK